MVSLPLWAVFVVSIGSPMLAFLGVVVAQFVARRGASELESRSKREETMRNLRWAAELSASDDGRLAALGLSQLESLLWSDLLDDTEKVFVEAALDTIYEDVETELEELGTEAEAVDGPDPVPSESDVRRLDT